MSLNAFAADPGKLSAYPTADGSFIITARKETVLHHEIACFRKYNDSAANIETRETNVL